MRFCGYFFLVLFLFSPGRIQSQSILIGTASEERLRAAQVVGLLPARWALLSKPTYKTHYLFEEGDSTLASAIWTSTTSKKRLRFSFTPIFIQSFINSDHPWGQNDNGVWQGTGMTQSLRGGVSGAAGPLEFQFQPEFTWAQNRPYDTLSTFLYANTRWRSINQRIDTPYWFGDGAIRKLYAGQSFVKLNAGRFHAGVSSENMWWGPGIYQALILSNNAPGFVHVFAGTRAPVHTWFGSFDFRMFGGRLENSGQQSYKRVDQWRYVSGITFSYAPRFLPGLSVGINRVFQTNERDFVDEWKSYVPFLQDFLKEGVATDENPLGDDLSDQIASVTARWVMPETRAEFYGEYARADHSWDARDLTLQIEHTSGYMFGFRKDALTTPGRHLFAGLELTRLEKTNTRITRPAPDLYTHYIVLDGWTHRGQLLGASIGPGSNLRSVFLTYMDARTMYGFKLSHQSYNNSFYYEESTFRYNRNRLWVDITASFSGTKRISEHLLLQSQLNLIRTLNRHYELGKDVWNVNVSFGVQYGI